MLIAAFLRLPLPVMLALGALLLILGLLAWLLAGLRQPAVVRAAEPVQAVAEAAQV